MSRRSRHQRKTRRRVKRRSTRRLRKQRGGGLKENLIDAIKNVANSSQVRAFLAEMEISEPHAGFPRGPYEGNKYVYALIAPVDEQNEPNNYNMSNYDHPHKIIVMEMKVDGENISDLVITLHPNKTPNSLDDQYAPDLSLTHGDNPVANAIEAGVYAIKQAWEEEGGAGGAGD